MHTNVTSISALDRHRSKRGEPTCPLLQSEERQIAWDLYSKDLTYAEIGAQMGISAIRARDLCRRYQRALQERSEHTFERELSTRALTSLLNGKHARKIPEKAQRLVRLVEIAACYTLQELRDERNVGGQTFREIESWLARKGLGFRAPTETIENALDRLKVKTHSVKTQAWSKQRPTTGQLQSQEARADIYS